MAIVGISVQKVFLWMFKVLEIYTFFLLVGDRMNLLLS